MHHTSSDHPQPASPFEPGPPPRLWPARWIAHPSASHSPVGVYHFRKTITFQAVPPRLRAMVSADNRYQLFVNGVRVSLGPARGDLPHWRYETVDLAPHLRPGANTIAAVTWYLGFDLSPWAQIGHAPGFILCAHPDDDAASLNTPEGWRCARNDGYGFISQTSSGSPGPSVVGPGELVDAARYPWGWELPQFDDSGWEEPVALEPGSPRGARDAPSIRWLVPTSIPPMEERPEQPMRLVRAEGVPMPDGWPIVVPPNTSAAILLDNGHLTTAYPQLDVEGGPGSVVRMRYAEALWEGPLANQKGDRNEVEGRQMRGYRDEVRLSGMRIAFRPLWWRTYRYLQLEVDSGERPVTIHGLRSAFTAYPFQERGRFSSSDASLVPIWEVGWRTVRLCAHETYMDCPYYEQLQYGGDTRIQCLVSYYVSGDGRLARNAIAQLDDSRLPDGITQSRYPSHQTQIIPPFALWWIGMLHDYWMFQDDPGFVFERLPGVRAVLEWFERHLRDDGLLGPLPWWNFVDWAREFPHGVPPGADEGGSSILSLQMVLALREAAEMEQAHGSAPNAARFRELADQISDAVRARCWVWSRGLLADTPAADSFSQHATSLGILAGCVPPDDVPRAARLLLSEPPERLAQATFYFRFYVHRALRAAGLGDEYLQWLQPWRDMLAIGLTTWAETPEPTRSDCHAWSSHPNVDLLATVLGVEPAAPGFARVSIAPHLGPLTWAGGVVPHPRGEVYASFRLDHGRLSARITLPQGVPGVLSWRGVQHNLHPGDQELELPG